MNTLLNILNSNGRVGESEITVVNTRQEANAIVEKYKRLSKYTRESIDVDEIDHRYHESFTLSEIFSSLEEAKIAAINKAKEKIGDGFEIVVVAEFRDVSPKYLIYREYRSFHF